MPILYKNVWNVRFVLFTKTSIGGSQNWDLLCRCITVWDQADALPSYAGSAKIDTLCKVWNTHSFDKKNPIDSFNLTFEFLFFWRLQRVDTYIDFSIGSGNFVIFVMYFC